MQQRQGRRTEGQLRYWWYHKHCLAREQVLNEHGDAVSNLGRSQTVSWSEAPERCWYTRVPRVQHLTKEAETTSMCAVAKDTQSRVPLGGGCRRLRS